MQLQDIHNESCLSSVRGLAMSQNARSGNYGTFFPKKTKKKKCFFLKINFSYPSFLSLMMSQTSGVSSCCFCKKTRHKPYNIPVGYKGPVFPPSGSKKVQMCCLGCTNFAKAYVEVSPPLPPSRSLITRGFSQQKLTWLPSHIRFV